MNSPESSELSSLSSGLSSVGSLSPPPEYPSPPPSQDYSSSASETTTKKRSLETDDAPSIKKRRKVEPKPRTTEYLSLPSPTTSPADQGAQLAVLLKALRKRRKIVVIAGAGISVSAGIPDFRSSNGLFALLRNEHKLRCSGKDLFDASVYQTEEGTADFHDMIRKLSGMATAAKPTPFHHLVAKLSAEGRLMRLYTQNVDGLETSMPPLQTTHPLDSKGPWPRTVCLHGGLDKMVCTKCKNISDFKAALFNGSIAPACPVCEETDKIRTDHAGKRSHGIGGLRPRMVLYNEPNPEDEAIGAIVNSDLRARPDAVIVVGTSMKVPGLRRIVREMCGVVRSRKDGVSVWINRDVPPLGKEFEDCWDLVVKGDCDNVAAHADFNRWDDHRMDHEECTESDVERAKAKNPSVQVVIGSQAKKSIASALLTPAPSPRSKSVEAPKRPNFAIQIPALLKPSGKVSANLPKSGLSKALKKPLASDCKVTKPVSKKSAMTKKASAIARPLANAKITSTFKTKKFNQPTAASEKAPTRPTKSKQVVLGDSNGSTGSKMTPRGPNAAPFSKLTQSQTPRSIKWTFEPQSKISTHKTQFYVPSYERTNASSAWSFNGVGSDNATTVDPVFSAYPMPEEAHSQYASPRPEQQERDRILCREALGRESPKASRPVLPPLSMPQLPQFQPANNHSLPDRPATPLTPGFAVTQTTPSRPCWEKCLSPGFEVHQTTPSRPPWERSVNPITITPPSPEFVMAQKSPSCPTFEKIILPSPIYQVGSRSSTWAQRAGLSNSVPAEGKHKASTGKGVFYSNTTPVQLYSPILIIDTQKAQLSGQDRLKRLSQEIVSPTSFPPKMAQLLN